MNKREGILTGQALSGLYAITDAALMPSESLLTKAEAALRGGCRVLQYRCKNRAANTLQEAQGLRDLCQRYRALFIVNDDPVLAQRVNANGVHLGQSDAPVAQTRKQLGEQAIIGVSCHNCIESAVQAEAQGANYVAFGRFFDSHTKPQAPVAELMVLSQAKRRIHIPVVAIGGITRDNAPLVIEQGADMIAVIHDLFAFDDVEERAKQLSKLFL